MTVAMEELPNDVALLKRLFVEERQLRESLIRQIRAEAARQLEAQAQRHAAELKAAIAPSASCRCGSIVFTTWGTSHAIPVLVIPAQAGIQFLIHWNTEASFPSH